MRRIQLYFCLSVLGLVFIPLAALGHTPILVVEDNEDGTVYVEGAFSTGATAAGLILRVEDAKGKVLWEGKFDEDGCATVAKPGVPYWVVMDAGPGHVKKVKGPAKMGEGEKPAAETEEQEKAVAEPAKAEAAPAGATPRKSAEAEGAPRPAGVSPAYTAQVPNWAPGVTITSQQPGAMLPIISMVAGQLSVIATVAVLLLAGVCLYIGFVLGRRFGQ